MLAFGKIIAYYMGMNITETKLSDLIFAEYNPRQLSNDQFKQIKDSITRFGIVDPIIVNSNKDRKNIIIGGHQRVKVALEMGIDSVPCHFIDLTRDKERELNIRLNKNTGEWDWDVLAGAFDVDELIEWGFSDDELDFPDPTPTEGLTDEDAVPEVEESITKPGDLWILGEHRVLCGDATISTDVETLMDGQRADLVITDPPYNVDYEGKTKDKLKIQNDKMEDTTFRTFLKDAFLNIDMNLKPGGVFYIWHADSEGYNFRGACHDILWEVRQCLIWNKNHMVMGRQDYHWKHEPCLYGWKDGAGHLWSTDRKQTTILEFNRPSASKLHPTMKPVDLISYQITNNTKGEDIIIDTFLGSGSTLIACEKTGRKCYGMELDTHYCDVIVKRWEEFTGKKAELG